MSFDDSILRTVLAGAHTGANPRTAPPSPGRRNIGLPTPGGGRANLVKRLRTVAFTNRCAPVLLLVAAVTACSGDNDETPTATPVATAEATAATPAAATPAATVAPPTAEEAPIPPTPSPYDALPESVRQVMDKPFTGDFDDMVKRRAIRVAVTFNRTHYFVDEGQERGLTYESVKSFENDLNKDLKTGNLKVHMVMVPMSREQLYPELAGGKVDLVAAMITVTPEREKLVAFSEPTRTNVKEVVVTGPGAPPIASLDDLAGQEVFVRKGSVYEESLVGLNAQLKARGKPPVVIVPAPEVLEDDDVLEMVNAGLAPITVVDDYLAEFWVKIFTSLQVHRDLAVRSDGVLAIALRKENPKLRAVVNTWIRKHGKGDAFRNVIERRYLQDGKYAKTAAAEAERKKLQAVVDLFKKYGSQYKIDYLLMAAQGYQESTLDHSVRSPVGAVGVMQVMPATGKSLNVGNITEIEPNIHAGVKYMRFMMDEYFKNEPMDDLNKALMTFAAYNAGPGRLRQLRREAAAKGLNPNVWFGNVERIASERIGRETVTYVSNIFKYYVSYRLLQDQQERRTAAKAQVETRK
jgi:membrane-bound lytic murein transglycosylase MltF